MPQLPTNLDFELYFNIAFFAVIGIGFLVGLIRGLKKSLYSLAITALFYAIFFITIDIMVNQLWILPLPFVFSQLGGMLPGIENAVSLGDAFAIVLEDSLGEMVGDMLTNEQFVAFVTGVALFAVKLVYTVLYFTVGFVLYRFVTFIIRIIFFGKTQAEQDYKLASRQIRKMKLKNRDLRKMKKGVRQEFKKMTRKERRQQIKMDRKLNKKRVRNKEFKRIKKETKMAIKQMTRKERRSQTKLEKRRQTFILKNGYYFNERQLSQHMNKPSKLPLLGGVAGAAKGALTAFVSLIIIGGMINIMDSFMQVLPQDSPTISHEYLEEVYLANSPVITSNRMEVTPVALFEVTPELEDQLDLARDVIDAFNNNLFVSNASSITYTDDNYDGEVPLHLYLFDSVLSFNFKDEKIMFRQELDTLSNTVSILSESAYNDTNNISDITQEEIIALFDTLSNSKLITTLLPLGIEVGSEVLDVPMELPLEELYAIDWQAELQQLGSVAAVGFGLVNTAGLLNDEADLTTVTLDGTEVESFFDSLAGSELATLGAYVAIEPLLQQAGGNLSAIITIPEGLVWADEFSAFGEVAKAVLDTGITMDQLSAGDPMALIGSLSTLDFTVLLSSEIVTQAMINIFSGEAGLDGLDIIVIPDGIEWRDLIDGDDTIRGELFNILTAINELTSVVDGFSFDAINLSVIADFDNATIDALFNSGVLVATISNYITNELDFGDTPLLIPDSVFDLNGYITSVEMKAVANSARVLITDLPCDVDDTECETLGFDLDKVFNLSTTSIDTMVESEIIGATVGNLIIDTAGDVLSIPGSALEGIFVDSVQTFVVSRDEISSLFQAVTVLEFDDLDTLEFDVGILNRLALDADPTVLDDTKTDTLFGSIIIHSTISDMLIDLEDTDDILAVPYFAQDGTTEIREYDAEDDIYYISIDELESILQALITLDIQDFNAIDTLDLNLIIDNSDEILASSILQATVSKQVFALGSDVVTVPVQDQDGAFVRVSVGDVLEETDTEYITVAEINAILDALVVLDATDIQNFSGDVDIELITSEPGNITTLLSSATIHATISQQLLNLAEPANPGDPAVLSVPFKAADDITFIRISVGPLGQETEYIIKTEIEAMIDVLNVLGITSNLEEFDGSVNIGDVLDDPTGVDTLLASATIHATISKQLFDLEDGGTLAVPYMKEDNLTAVRVTVGDVGEETEYIIEAEVRALLDVLDLLGIADDLDNFDGSVNIGDVLDNPTGVDTLLASATIHATISKQLFDLEDGGTLAVPYMEEDDLTTVRVTVGGVGEETEYIKEAEVRALLDVLDLLGIADDLENFDGAVDLSVVLADPANYDILLASATIHATISKQLFDLGGNDTLAVPFFKEDSSPVRVTVGGVGEETEYVIQDEVRALLDVLDLLGITDDLENFNGDIDMGTVLADPANYDILLASATIHATISKQLFDLDVAGTLVVPYMEENGITPVRISVGVALDLTDTNYITEVEVRALLDALDVLGLTDNLEAFDGGVDIASATQVPGNTAILLGSSTIQATISKQLVDLDATDDIQLPYLRENDTTDVRVTVGGVGEETEYVVYNELEALIDAMNILGITGDISGFDASTVDLSILGQGSNADSVFTSAMIQATVSRQVVDLTSDPGLTDTFIVPYLQDDDATEVRFEVGDNLAGTDTEYILKAELVNLVKGLDLLGITDVSTFNGDIDLNTFFDPLNRTVLLSSSIMQATISAQLIEIDDNTLAVPFVDINASAVRLTVADGDPIKELEYITVAEIDAIFGAFKELNITNFDNFTGTIDISVLDNETKQDAVLASASIHAKISNLLTTLDSAVLIVPTYDQDGETPGNEVRLEVGDPGEETEYVVKGEVKALMNSFTAMGFTDLNNFGSEIASTEFFTARATLLLSSSIQATISDKMINGTGGALIVPDEDIRPVTAFDIRLVHGDGVEYIQIDELNAIFDGLEALGLEDFTSMSFDPSTIFSADFDLVLSSASLQATISDNILPNAEDENVVAYSSGTLVIPTTLREAITVDSVGSEHIEKDELKQLLEAMNALGFTNDFGSGVGGGSITSMNDATLDEMFDSGSIHLTIDFMLRDNSALTIPTQAEVNLAFHNNITSETEIRKFLLALNTLGQADFSNASFGLAALASISSYSDRETIADAMITRATLHDEVEVLALNPFLYPAGVTAADYMESNTGTFFIYSTFLDIVETVYPSTLP